MKTKSIKSSNWARRFRRSIGRESYQEALDIHEYIMSEKDGGVSLYHNNENGDWLWSIVPYWDSIPKRYDGFWLDSAPTKKRALEICKEMGWKVLK